jgi:hypothetical protein
LLGRHLLGSYISDVILNNGPGLINQLDGTRQFLSGRSLFLSWLSILRRDLNRFSIRYGALRWFLFHLLCGVYQAGTKVVDLRPYLFADVRKGPEVSPREV